MGYPQITELACEFEFSLVKNDMNNVECVLNFMKNISRRITKGVAKGVELT